MVHTVGPWRGLAQEANRRQPHAAEGAWKVVNTAMDLQGGFFSIFKAAECERLWRDARLAKIPPSNEALAIKFVSKTVLGINPDESLRRG